MNKIFNIVLLLILLVTAFFFRDTLQNVWYQAFNHYFPCKVAISYSIGEFDTRFGISKTDFIKSLSDAEKIWETPISRDLFKYSETGELKINLVYDNRQKSTVLLQKVGTAVKQDKSTYDALKLSYDSAERTYEADKAGYEVKVANFNARRNKYEQEVSVLNRKGGADEATYSRLNAEKNYLSSQVEAINSLKQKLNQEVDNINSLASELNQLVGALNLNVNQFNTIGSSLGGEFEEGTYQSSKDGQQIDIYQYENKSKLVRVLAHEFGHALGLDHNDDPKAIMYRLNNGVNEKLTSADLSQLQNLCGIK